VRSKEFLSDTQLAAAVELNHVESIHQAGNLPWVELHHDKDVSWVFAGDTWPRNVIAGTRFAPEAAHKRVGEILAYHLKAKVACNWVVGPFSEPAELSQHLRAHGFHCMIHCVGMACRLPQPRTKPPMASGIAIKQVDIPPPLRPPTTERRRLQQQAWTLQAQIKPRRSWHLSAEAAGQPVGETTLFTGAGVAGIYGVEVLKDFRGRGIGTSLVFSALQLAVRLGYNAAVLSATGMGKGVYERVGFREVCKLSFWKYGKMRQLRE